MHLNTNRNLLRVKTSLMKDPVEMRAGTVSLYPAGKLCLPFQKTGTLGLFVFTCASKIQLGAGETCLVLCRFDLPEEGSIIRKGDFTYFRLNIVFSAEISFCKLFLKKFFAQI